MSVAALPIESKSSVMIVDDNPANLKLLEDLLRGLYEVRSFPLGRLALAAAEHEPPDLILLDINMPEMNGYQVCEKLKSTSPLAGIPVIFLSALDAVEDKVRGFRSGGADYISKPFQFEEVQARIETHLRLRRTQKSECELLERTLSGALASLLDLVQITSPMLVLRSQAVREIVRHISRRMGLADAWQFEIAAMLCLLGSIVMPNDLFERAYLGQELSPDENQVFRAHPAAGARLISNIPRMEVVAEIVRLHRDPEAVAPGAERVKLGVQMLQLSMELDRKLLQGIECPAAIDQLRASGNFNSKMLDALDGFSLPKTEFALQSLPVQELRAGMVLDEDIIATTTGLSVLKQGMLLSPTWIDRLGNFAKTSGVQERVRVRVPKAPGIPLLPKGRGSSEKDVYFT